MPRRQWIESMIESTEARRRELHESDREIRPDSIGISIGGVDINPDRYVMDRSADWGGFSQQAPRRYDDAPIGAWGTSSIRERYYNRDYYASVDSLRDALDARRAELVRYGITKEEVEEMMKEINTQIMKAIAKEIESTDACFHF